MSDRFFLKSAKERPAESKRQKIKLVWSYLRMFTLTVLVIAIEYICNNKFQSRQIEWGGGWGGGAESPHITKCPYSNFV